MRSVTPDGASEKYRCAVGPTARYVAGRERILGNRTMRPLAEREPRDVAEELADTLGLIGAATFLRAVHKALMNLTKEPDSRGA